MAQKCFGSGNDKMAKKPEKKTKATAVADVNKVAKQIKEQHENSRAVFSDGKRIKAGPPLIDEERFSSLYEMDYHYKKVSPSTPRPCSVTRRNNPHPSQMFMHWKVPTRLIVDDPSYRRQKATLLADSNQRFYEDINGTRECIPVSHEVLAEVARLKQLSPTKLAKLQPSWHSAHTHTTHYSTPYNMFKQMREADMERELKESVKVEKQQVTKLPAVPFSGSGAKLTQKAIARSLNPKAVPAAENWLRSVGNKSEKKVVQRALQAADKSYVDSTLKRALQPDAKKAVEKWMESATSRDREVAIEFFGSLAGAKLMGARDVCSHDPHRDHKAELLCKICDGDKLQQVMAALKKGNPVAAVTLRKGKNGPEKLRHLRLLTPATRSKKEEFQTWHHLPSFQHAGPVSNTIALFTRPHRPIQRHFTIHPEWE